MCTVSWLHQRDGYQLFFNRDEKHSRLAASPVQVRLSNGVRYLAPADGDYGGTWLAVNEFGLTLALLNGRPGAVTGKKSRGQLVTALAGARSIDEARQQVTGDSLESLANLSLLILECGQPALLLEWDSPHLSITGNAEKRMPLTSSSFDPEGVERRRHEEFAARLGATQRVDANLLLEFHRSHGLRADTPGADSICMHRDDAHTVSFSWVEVSKAEVRFFYSPAAPCEKAPGTTVRLSRTGEAPRACE